MSARASELLHRSAGDVYPLGSTTATELTGGLKSGDVLELVGSAASGKTEMCIATAVATVQRRDAHVLYFTSQPVQAVVQRLVAVALASTKACMQREMRDSPESVSQLTTAACRHMLSLVSVHGVRGASALQEQLCSLLPGAEQQHIGQRTAVLIVDSMGDMLPPWRSAASKRGRYAAQAAGAATGRLLRLLACSCHCAVLTTSSCKTPIQTVLSPIARVPRYDGTQGGWEPFVAATAAVWGGGDSAFAWMHAAAQAAHHAQEAASLLPHAPLLSANAAVHVQGTAGGAGGAGPASTADTQLTAAAVRAPSRAATAPPAWEHTACIIKRTHVASPSNARLASMHVGSGGDGARAGSLQLPLATAALAAGDVANALASHDRASLAKWHASEWHESLLDMGVAAGAVGKHGVSPPVQPTANSITHAAAAWSARKSKDAYEPQRIASRQGKFARVGAPPLPSTAAPGRGFWAMRAAALGLLQEPASLQQ